MSKRKSAIVLFHSSVVSSARAPGPERSILNTVTKARAETPFVHSRCMGYILGYIALPKNREICQNAVIFTFNVEIRVARQVGAGTPLHQSKMRTSVLSGSWQRGRNTHRDRFSAVRIRVTTTQFERKVGIETYNVKEKPCKTREDRVVRVCPTSGESGPRPSTETRWKQCSKFGKRWEEGSHRQYSTSWQSFDNSEVASNDRCARNLNLIAVTVEGWLWMTIVPSNQGVVGDKNYIEKGYNKG
ncbi:hypothetical protein EDB92DRAFT_1817018 [Lactarius akahatsu]|uniref:Uncharacterized protein n=1 Tax=Lactarius akahatsu TaxID=416441 RepID=A0AAD4LFF8_9AGAM|nr:hypothetical protein EDB92DRAFT_1817018 [Lactarius akahatsu]